MTCDELSKKEDLITKKNNEISKLVLQEIIEATELHITSKDSISYVSQLYTLLMKHVYGSNYESVAIKILKDHGYNGSFEIKNALCNLGVSGPEKIKHYTKSPYISDIQFDGKFQVISPEFGTINMTLAGHYFDDNPRVRDYIAYNQSTKNCHNHTRFLAPEYPEYYSVTSLVPHYFYGKYHHSYTYDKENGLVIDLCSNSVMDKETYDKLYQPEPVSIIKNTDVSRELAITEENTDQPKERYALFKIALYKEVLSAEKGDESRSRVLSLLP